MLQIINRFCDAKKIYDMLRDEDEEMMKIHWKVNFLCMKTVRTKGLKDNQDLTT